MQLSASCGQNRTTEPTWTLLANTFQSLRLLTHVRFFSKTESDTFRSVFIYGKEQEFGKKVFHNRAKKSSFREGLTVEMRFFRYREI